MVKPLPPAAAARAQQRCFVPTLWSFSRPHAFLNTVLAPICLFLAMPGSKEPRTWTELAVEWQTGIGALVLAMACANVWIVGGIFLSLLDFFLTRLSPESHFMFPSIHSQSGVWYVGCVQRNRQKD
jgi:hypothetical protein